MKSIITETPTINKWWDSLEHETKKDYIKRMNRFNYGDVISVSAISKAQRAELYDQVHLLNSKKLAR